MQNIKIILCKYFTFLRLKETFEGHMYEEPILKKYLQDDMVLTSKTSVFQFHQTFGREEPLHKYLN